jgi:hypothetical protein
VGLMRQVLVFNWPLGIALAIQISTIRSVTTFVPVVSRSKNARGFFSFKECMGEVLVGAQKSTVFLKRKSISTNRK